MSNPSSAHNGASTPSAIAELERFEAEGRPERGTF